MKKTILFYDGHCGFCRNVAYHYNNVKGHEKVMFVNIYDKKKFEQYRQGISFAEAKKVIHARLPNGEIKYGAEAILALWSIFPNYKFLVSIFDHPVTKPVMHLFYRVLAKSRKHIPSFLLRQTDPV